MRIRVALMLLVVLTASVSASAERPPNIVVIFADDK